MGIGKGLPDIENLKRLSQIFGISIDDLLSSKETEFYGVYREQIGLGHYEYHPKLHGVWRKSKCRPETRKSWITSSDF